jgi:sterol desaturase/sphingolipid hydroxylase (fatty acid hydroxylase superfamily)
MTLLLVAVIGFVFIALFTREVIAPASHASCNKRWLRMASGVNLGQMLAAIAIGSLFQENIKSAAIFQLPNMPAAIAGGIAFLVASFFAYWWHRLLHKSPTLWRLIHQLHHSPNRVETLTAFYAHPLDSAFATLLNCAVSYLLLGLDSYAAAWAILYVSLFNFYIHSDTRSPRWLGILVQRPEMHRVHHELDHHAQNYGLPLWDLLFGTWANPTAYVSKCGFSDQRESLIFEMLRGQDVNMPRKDQKVTSDASQETPPN